MAGNPQLTGSVTERPGRIYAYRLNRVREQLRVKGHSTLLVLKYQHIFYLTGFYGRESNSILIITPKKTILLAGFIFYEDAVKALDKSDIEVVLFKSSRIKNATEILHSLDVKDIAVGASEISYSVFARLKSELKKQKMNLVPAEDMVSKLRAVKDGYEIDKIRETCRITDLAFEAILGCGSERIKDLDEITLVANIEQECIKNGGYGRSFDYVVASGEGSSKPHHMPSRKNISHGILMVDFGTVYCHYCSDMTRTVFIGDRKPDKRLNEIYRIVLEAQSNAIDSCREGISCMELDSIARKYIADAGYGDYFGHSLGHGVGLEVHEEPHISANNKAVLKENMVVTLEPGIYIPGLGGVRIEDMVVVGKRGCENLYSARKEFTFPG